MIKLRLEHLEKGDYFHDLVVVVTNVKTMENGAQTRLFAEVGDKTGTLSLAPMWDASKENIESFKSGNFISISGNVTEYQGAKQLNLNSYCLLEKEDVDFMEYNEALPLDILEQNKNILIDKLNSIGGKWGEFVRKVYFEERHEMLPLPDKFKNNFDAVCIWRGAKGHHHHYLGGLNEHLLECDDIIKDVYPIFSEKYRKEDFELDIDLARASSFLTDLMKLMDYTLIPGEVGEFIKYGSHILDSRDYVIEVNTKHNILNFEEMMKLKFCISSHHGEFGPIKSEHFIPESHLIHFSDQISAKLMGALTELKKGKVK